MPSVNPKGLVAAAVVGAGIAFACCVLFVLDFLSVYPSPFVLIQAVKSVLLSEAVDPRGDRPCGLFCNSELAGTIRLWQLCGTSDNSGLDR